MLRRRSAIAGSDNFPFLQGMIFSAMPTVRRSLGSAFSNAPSRHGGTRISIDEGNDVNYDKQLIIVMKTPPHSNLVQFGRNLFNKHRAQSELVEYDVATKAATIVNSCQMGGLTENSRIQIVAHGNLIGSTAAGRTGKAMAKFIATKAAPGVKRLKKISLIVCYGAGNPTRPDSLGPNQGFAAEFHFCLRNDYQVDSQVTARSATMIVNDQGRKQTRVNYQTFGEPYKNKAEGIKYLYSWVEGTQVVSTVSRATAIDDPMEIG
ncbi:hypothetical protein DBR42_03785 [Pelomonas sp. HMWF004]|nr:hypothetical protein DBR42_03785 [Pelomonas sp. HMWF004]